MPISLLAFPLVALVYIIQTIPVLGIMLLMTGSPIWTGTLFNYGMIGLVIELPLRRYLIKPNSQQGYLSDSGRISLFWMLIPIAYASWYGVNVYQDQAALEKLGAEFDAINSEVVIPFDPEVHDLVFVGTDPSLGPEYGLPTIFTQNENSPIGFGSSSLLEKEVCDEINSNGMFRALSIRTFGFLSGDALTSYGVRGTISKDFCRLSMMERPTKPIVSITKTTNKTKVHGLPVTLTQTTVTMPSGNQFILRGGVAAPYHKYPRPIAGCALNSGGPSWECGGGFLRDTFTPIISGKGKFGRDGQALAKALGLKKVSPDQLRAIDPQMLDLKMQEQIDARLEEDLVYVRALITDPSAIPKDGGMDALEYAPANITRLAPEIVSAIKRAAGPHPDGMEGINRASRGAWLLARLFGKLPPEVQNEYADEITQLYREADENGDGRHWLYQAKALLRFRQALPQTFAPPSLLAE